MAATITSLMTGTSYARSAELAGVVGPYNGYARNADAHKRVMRKHQAANDQIRTMHTMDKDIHAYATKAWDAVVKVGEKQGYRNAQASVLAPTGTIGFMMDCDTTGIEPLAHPLETTQRLRADVVTERNQRDAYQAIAPAVEEGLYLVPRVIE